LLRVLNKTNAGAYRRSGFDRLGCTDDNLRPVNHLKDFLRASERF
jgi:hypothetical protein